MKRENKAAIKSFIIEAAVYGVLVTGYFFLVLHFLGDALYHMFKEERKLYATVALALIIGQGIVLEILTRALLNLIQRKGDE
jgi:hypothetical protein